MRLLKPLILALFGLLASVGVAQIPPPQINLSGNIGCAGFPCVNNGTLNLTIDANHTMTAQETSALYIKITSSIPLTATHNLIVPTGRFPFTIENATTGGHSIQIIGASGTGITIPNGTTVSVWNDGTNYVQVGGNGSNIVDISDVTTSRAFGTVYQNTNAFSLGIYAGGTVSGIGCTLNPAIGITSSPTMLYPPSSATPVSGAADVTTTFIVPPNDYYEIGNDNCSLNRWIEVSLPSGGSSGGSGSGSVTTVSVATANGFQGTVANPTTTPAITISTDGTHVLPTNTGSSTTFLNGAGAYTTPAGGFTNPMTAVGDVIYGGASGAATRLPGNTAATDEVLVSHGTGTTATAPSYSNAPALSAANMTGLVLLAPTASQAIVQPTGTAIEIESTITAITTPTSQSLLEVSDSNNEWSVNGDLTLDAGQSGTGTINLKSENPVHMDNGSGTAQKITNLANGTNASDAVNFSQLSGAGGTPVGGNAVQGSNTAGTAFAATNPTTTLNALPLFEYTNVPRQPLATWFQVNHNCGYQVAGATVFGDSFTIIDVTNGGTGPTISTNRWPEQLRINGQVFCGSHGTGAVPMLVGYGAGASSPSLNNEAWSCTGTYDFTTGGALGPSQSSGGAAMDALVHLSAGAVCTFNDTRGIQWDTFHIYYATSSSTGDLTLVADGGTSLGAANVSTGAAAGATAGGLTARRFDSAALATGTHTVTITAGTGGGYVYAGSGSNGTTGFEVNMIGIGASDTSMWGSAPATQLTFADLIPNVSLAYVGFLTNDVGHGISGPNFTTYLTNIISHETALNISVLQEIPPVDSLITGLPMTRSLTAVAVSLCGTLPIGCTNIQNQWGTTYNNTNGIWVTGSFAGTHPNDKGAEATYAQVYGASLDPAPYNLPTGVLNRNGFSISQLGGQFQGFVANGTSCVFCDLFNPSLGYDFGQGQGAAQVTFIANSPTGLGLINSIGMYLGTSVTSNYTNSDFYFTQAGMGMKSGSFLGWSSSTTNAGTADTAMSALCDTSLVRIAAEVVGVGGCTSGSSITGQLELSMLLASNSSLSFSPVNGENNQNTAVTRLGVPLFNYVAPNVSQQAVATGIFGVNSSVSFGVGAIGYAVQGTTPSASSCSYLGVGGSTSTAVGIAVSTSGYITLGTTFGDACNNTNQLTGTGFSIAASGAASTPQIIATGSAPTCTVGSAAGSGATCSITGTNMAGVLTLNTGTATTGAATLVTVVFNGTLGTAPQGCTIQARNSSAAGNVGMEYTNAPSTTAWTIAEAIAAPAISSTFVWSYGCL